MCEGRAVGSGIVRTHRFQLNDIAKAYRLQEKRQGGPVKCFAERAFPRRAWTGTRS